MEKSKLIASILLSTALFSSSICTASPLTPEAALSRAIGNTGHKNLPARGMKDYRLVYTEPRSNSDEAAVYVFATGDKGYIIASADDVAYPVLGYSDEPFDESAMSLGWIKEYARQIEAADSTTQADDKYPFKEYDRIEPMIKTHWGNGSIYRDHTPQIDGKPCHPGDMAVAMAQIMNYHKYPAVGQGQNKYNSNGETISYDFSTLKLDWDAMLPAYDENCTDEQKSAIAELIAACGKAVNTQYDVSNSTMTLEDGASGLVNFFAYDKGISVNLGSYYKLNTWIDKVYSHLAANEPLIYLFISPYYNYSGTPIYSSYICDGYESEGFFHFNANKGGKEDGYYRLEAVTEQLEPTHNYHCFISNLCPKQENSQVEINLGMRYAYYFSIGNLKPGKIGSLVNVGSLTNHSIETVTGMPVIEFMPKDGTPTYGYLYPKENISLKAGATIESFNIRLPELAEGQYDMTLKFQTDDGIIHPIKHGNNYTKVANVSNGLVSVDEYMNLPINIWYGFRGNIYWDEEFFLEVHFENGSSYPVEKQLYLCAYNKNSERLAAWCDPITVKLDAKENTEYITMYPKFTHFIDSECVGNSYYIEFTDPESMEFISQRLYPQSILAGKCPNPLEINTFRFIGDSWNADPTNLEIKLSVKNQSGIHDLKSGLVLGFSDGKYAYLLDNSCLGDDTVLMPQQVYEKTITIEIQGAEAGKRYDLMLGKRNGEHITFEYSLPVTMATSGIEDVTADDGEAEYYNLQGVRVDNPSHGYYIKRTGSKATKVYVQ